MYIVYCIFRTCILYIYLSSAAVNPTIFVGLTPALDLVGVTRRKQVYIILIRPNLEPAIQNPCIYSVYTVLDLVGKKNRENGPSGFHFSTGCIYSSLARKQESGISVLASTFRQCVYTVASMYPRIQNPATAYLYWVPLCAIPCVCSVFRCIHAAGKWNPEYTPGMA